MLLTKLSPYFIQIGDFSILWYAVFILTGAVLAYLTSQYFMKKDGHSGEILENAFFLLFPAGIVGAKIWSSFSYLGDYIEQGQSFAEILLRFVAIWEPGLAIQGGVMAGVAVGLWYFRKFHPQLRVRYLLDIVVPNILIAQAIGRWGNFFNQEVYGQCVEPSQLNFLPNFIVQQMTDTGNTSYTEHGNRIVCATDGLVAQPLFLYEMLLNTLGFFLITFVLRKYWTKGRVEGDLGFLYFVWYGIVRALLEPLRQAEFILLFPGTNIPQSIVTSIAFVLAGLGLMALNRIKLRGPKSPSTHA